MHLRWLLLASLAFGLAACTSNTEPPRETSEGSETEPTSDDEPKQEETSGEVPVNAPTTNVEIANTPYWVAM